MLAIDLSGLEAYLPWLDAQPSRITTWFREVYRDWAIHLHGEITELTPQWSGNLAANWALDVGAPSTAAVNYVGPSGDVPFGVGGRGGKGGLFSRGDSPAVEVSFARAKATRLPLLSEDLFIHNPVAYADRIEDDTSEPPVRAVNRLPRTETGKIAMVNHAFARHSVNGQALIDELRNRPL